MPLGWRIILLGALFLCLRSIWRRSAPWRRAWSDRLFTSALDKPGVFWTGDERFNRFLAEGLLFFGPNPPRVWAALASGLLLPLFVLLIPFVVYRALVLVHLWLVEGKGWGDLGVLLRWPMTSDHFLPFFTFMIVSAVCGCLVAAIRLTGGRRAAAASHPFARLAWSSAGWSAVLGWIVYFIWAAWPREGFTYSGALQHAWIWFFFGLLFSWYFHRMQNWLMFLLLRSHWALCVRAVVLRWGLHLQGAGDLRVAADPATGIVQIQGLRDPLNRARLTEQIGYVLGVREVRFMDGEGTVDGPTPTCESFGSQRPGTLLAI